MMSNCIEVSVTPDFLYRDLVPELEGIRSLDRAHLRFCLQNFEEGVVHNCDSADFSRLQVSASIFSDFV